MQLVPKDAGWRETLWSKIVDLALSFELWALEVALTGKNANFDHAYPRN